MKHTLKFSVLAAAIALTTACNTDADKNTSFEASTATLDTTEQKAAYALGGSFANQIEAGMKQQLEFSLTPLDKELIIAGVTDTFRGQGRFTEAELTQAMDSYGEEVQAAAQKFHEEQKVKSLAESSEFLATNAAVEGVIVTESGLQYSIMTKVDGPKPKAEDMVTVHYVGTLIDGTEFDSSIARGEPVKFPLNQVIAGWTEGVQLMGVGDKYKFVIPANLAEQTAPVPVRTPAIKIKSFSEPRGSMSFSLFLNLS